MGELKPCPFCGGTPCVIHADEFSLSVECQVCEASTAHVNAKEKGAGSRLTSIWNRRTAPCVHEFEANPGMTDSTHRYCVHCGRAEE